MAALQGQKACWVLVQERAEVSTVGNTDERDWAVCKMTADPSERTQYGVFACFVYSRCCKELDICSV